MRSNSHSAAVARVIGAVLRRLHGDLLIFAREYEKLQGLEIIAQQHLGRDDRRAPEHRRRSPCIFQLPADAKPERLSVDASPQPQRAIEPVKKQAAPPTGS